MLYLRKFKKLFSINLFGNPASKEDDYKLSIAAYFPNLMLLDYRLLDEKTVNINSFDSKQSCSLLLSINNFLLTLPKFVWKSCVSIQKKEAFTKYQFILEEMNRKELEMQRADEAKQLQEAEVKIHTVT